jgi:hypothetical protein
VVVTRPVGARCGAHKVVHLTLDAATVTSSLPVTITHDPVGLDTGLVPIPASGNPAITLPLINVGQQNNGAVYNIRVGQVLVVQPLQDLTTVTQATTPGR